MTRKYRLERTAFIGCRNEDEYNACIAALKTWNTRHAE